MLLQAGYTYTDPSTFGGFWTQEALLDAEVPEGACECGDTDGSVWREFQDALRENLAQDPEFEGPWVHEVCGSMYGTLFQFAILDPETQQLTVKGTACTAGLAAAAVVCAQSAAVRGRRGASKWQWHDAIVLDEGPSVGDHGPVELEECMRLCEERGSCSSFAFGPYGCHLKGRCSWSGDPLTPVRERAAGYRTYYRSSCPADPSADPRSSGAVDDFEGILGEIVLLVDMAMQLAEQAVHCFDGSAWPFSTSELIATRVLLAEVMLGAGGASGARDELLNFRWSRPSAGELAPSASLGRSMAEGDAGAVQRALTRARLRWTRRLNSEVGFWHILLDMKGEDKELDRSEEDAGLARQWVETGNVRWLWDEASHVCGRIRDVQLSTTGAHGQPRLLNTGSGPLAPPPLDCASEGFDDLGVVPVFASDGLGRFYLKLFDDLGIQPPRVTAQCPVEELRRCYPRHHFDIVHIRNALDHTMDPLHGLRQMLQITRPGGWVLLRHARNEGSPGQFQVGLHQWSFDATDGPDGRLHFMIWSPALRADVTRVLLQEGLAAEVRTELRPHPGREAEEGAENEYIWVDIRKPS